MRLLPALATLLPPPAPTLSARWCETRNTRPCMLRDFEKLRREQNIRIRDRAFKKGPFGKLPPRWTANLFAESAIYLLSR